MIKGVDKMQNKIYTTAVVLIYIVAVIVRVLAELLRMSKMLVGVI